MLSQTLGFAQLATSLVKRLLNPSSTASRPIADWRERQFRLRRLLTVHATDRVTGQRFRLVSDQLGPASLQFQCSTQLEAGRTLDLEMLLCIDCHVELFATVTAVTRRGRGCAGHMMLQTDAASRQKLECYLASQQRVI